MFKISTLIMNIKLLMFMEQRYVIYALVLPKLLFMISALVEQVFMISVLALAGPSFLISASE